MATTETHADVAAPPRENLVRALKPGLELRDGDAAGMPTMFGHFALFNRWTEIDSWFEGNFMERIAPGAFRKTIAENRDQVKVTFQHGQDPQFGDKPLGPIETLEEDRTGGFYEVPLLDTAYNRDLIPGLEAGLYGASFRFEVMREEFNQEPDASDSNPKGLPERTLKEIRLYEFGPVTFPAYAEADAQLRSLTDRFTFDAIERHPERFRELLSVERAALAATEDEAPAPGDAAGGTATSTSTGKRAAPFSPKPITREEFIGSWSS
jgi:HK97 family phage prohead protease